MNVTKNGTRQEVYLCLKNGGEILGKKVIIILVILIVIIFVVFFRAHLKIENTKTEYEKRVTSYLVDEKGYEKKDIKSVNGIYGIKSPPFYVIVVFEDEPYAQYFYFAHDGVKQYDYSLSNEAWEKGIIDETKLKNWDPHRYY
ncbi:DUF3139 domain-containing protein [Psychrobacillus sp. FSL H8-0510]|uniref:DUF3139 domain-containing protein n=1 Tax=Psychrobacillus sp. FSL H8-0510 TaxID=2921394 RepID=UPI0030F8344F